MTFFSCCCTDSTPTFLFWRKKTPEMQSFAAHVRAGHGEGSAEHLGRRRRSCHSRTAGWALHRPASPLQPRACHSVINDFTAKIQTYIYICIIHGSLVPVPCPKTLRVFNFIWTTTKSWCIPRGFTAPRNSRGSGHCQRRGNLSSWLTLESQLTASNHDRPLNYFDSLFVTGKQVQTCLERKDGVSLKVLEWELDDAGSFLNSATKCRCTCAGQFLSASPPHP